MDCLDYMRGLPDKAFALAIADPPYGIGEDGAKNHSRSVLAKAQEYTPKDWDRAAPRKEFFSELFRVSRQQIIWGANHFIENLPKQNASCWVVWDKENGENDFADCELAWTSLPCAVRLFRFRWAGMLQGNMTNKEQRIHPTQKPVALYAWILNKFATGGGNFRPNDGKPIKPNSRLQTRLRLRWMRTRQGILRLGLRTFQPRM